MDEEISKLIDQIVESIIQFHSIAPYVISLHAPFSLPQQPDGTLDLPTIKDKFISGTLESLYCLSLPWRNLESSLPTAIAPGCVVGAAGMVCGSVISGTTLSYKTGRELRPERVIPDTLPQQLAARMLSSTSDDITIVELFTQKEMNKTSNDNGRNRGVKLTAADLHKNATRIALMLERNEVAHGDLVLVAYGCPLKLICAIYGCWYRGAVPVPVKAALDGYSLIKCVAQQSNVTYAMVASKKTFSSCFEKHIKLLEIGN